MGYPSENAPLCQTHISGCHDTLDAEISPIPEAIRYNKFAKHQIFHQGNTGTDYAQAWKAIRSGERVHSKDSKAQYCPGGLI